MTVQYQVEDINGQPSPLSLVAIPTFTAAAGQINDAAAFWQNLADDTQIEGTGLEVAGDADVGSIIQFSQPGLFAVEFIVQTNSQNQTMNLIRGANQAITNANGFPFGAFSTGDPEGAFAIQNSPAPLAFTVLSGFIRITGTDLEDPIGSINPRRQLQISADSATIATFETNATKIIVTRVSR